MSRDPIPSLLSRVSEQRIRQALFFLASDPLPRRTLNFTVPGRSECTLYEADAFILQELEATGMQPWRESVPVQAFRCDTSKPKAHQYSTPHPDDPWYTAFNLYAERPGTENPEEIVLLVAHKDSQSWVASPGAYDNAVGTVALLEIARVLRECRTPRTVRFLFCNEEHTPWTSVTAAQRARMRQDRLVAVFNTDSLGGKSDDERRAGRKTNVTLYTSPEGERLAQLMAEVNAAYELGLDQRSCARVQPGDDDGSFIKAGYAAAIANLGSFPYADPNYHLETDCAEAVDIENVVLATRAVLAAVLRVAHKEWNPAQPAP